MTDESGLNDFGDETSSRVVSYKCSEPEVCSEKSPDSGNANDILKVITPTQWAIVGEKTYKPVSTTFPSLQSGVYNVRHCQYNGLVFEKKSICIDDLLRFPDSLSDKILAEITTFWNKGAKFKEHGFLHRRGYLLHGPAGSGKTSLVQQIISDIVSMGGIVFHCNNDPSTFNSGLSLFRKVEPFRPVVCLFEDIDAIVGRYGEDEILSLLDGENQIDKVLNLATTNYPEKLDKRLVSRPRRFDRVIKIGMPSLEVRRMYFSKKLNIPSDQLDEWAKATEGFSFAACAELVVSVCCFENPFDEAVNRLREMMRIKASSSDYDENPKGFSMRGN